MPRQMVYVFAGLGVLGVLLLGAGLVSAIRFAIRQGARAAAPKRILFLLLSGGLLVGCVGFVVWQRPQAFMQLIQGDVDNAARLRELQTASLETERPAAQAGWPQWQGPGRDCISHERELNTDWARRAPAVLWKHPVGGGYSSVAVVDGRLYATDRAGEEERVLCLDAASGRELWVFSYPARYAGFQSHATGPRATPLVHDGRVYTVGATGRFLCLEAVPAGDQPTVLWDHDLLTEFAARLPAWGVASSPLIEGDLVCVQPGSTRGSVAAFDRRTGKLVWSALSEVSGYSSPVAATVAGARQIICLTGKGLVGLRPADGARLWYYPWATEYDANIATPIVAGDYVFISSDYGAGCALLKVSSAGPDEQTAEPVYVRRNRLMRNHHSSCVLHDGHLYGFDSPPGVLKCVDLRTGEEKWMARNLRKGSLIYADGHLLVLTEHGTLALVEATPAGFRKKGEVANALQGSECWALPALASGRLYLRDHQQIVCLDLKSAQAKGDKE